ncbi:MAG: hypothetical protein IT165_06670 [Bryobacterales bacterium]|nr:hypothetical protein [Bryobacterales bacterium]
MHKSIDELHADVVAARKAAAAATKSLVASRACPERAELIKAWVEAAHKKADAVNAYNRAAHALNPGGSRSIIVLRLIEAERNMRVEQ